MNTSTSIHNISKIELLKTDNWNEAHGVYQSQKIVCYDNKGRSAFELTAYSDGEAFDEIKTPRKVVLVGNKTYYEDELAQALANIKEVK